MDLQFEWACSTRHQKVLPEDWGWLLRNLTLPPALQFCWLSAETPTRGLPRWPGLSHKMVAALPKQAVRQIPTGRSYVTFPDQASESHSIASVVLYSLGLHSPSQVPGETTCAPAPVRSDTVWESMWDGRRIVALSRKSAKGTFRSLLHFDLHVLS